MSYYPGCDDNDDSNERITLDAVIGYRGHYEAQLALLKADGDGYTVLGQFYPNVSIERLREMRGAELERICANLERLDADIARLSLADDDEFPADVGGYDPDAVIDAEFGTNADGQPMEPWDEYATGNRCAFCDGGDPQHCPKHAAEFHAREADEMRRDVYDPITGAGAVTPLYETGTNRREIA